MLQVISIILIVLFSLIFIGAILSAIAGFIKGIYKTSLRTIISFILTLIFIFVTPYIADSIASIDISNLGTSFEIFNETINVTTIKNTLAAIITASGLISPISGIPLYNVASALATSLISYPVFFILMISTHILSPILSAVLYNGIFRFFFKVETNDDRRYKKKNGKDKAELVNNIQDVDPEVENDRKKKLPLLRIPGAILGFAMEFVMMLLLVAPFSSLSKIVTDNKTFFEDYLRPLYGDKTDEIIEGINSLEDNPLIGFSNISDFDELVMAKASEVRIGDDYVSLKNLLDSAFDVAIPLFEDGAITFGQGSAQVTINYIRLLDSAMISSLVDSVLNNPILFSLIPPLVEVGFNMLENVVDIPVIDIDFDNIDWSNELTIIDEAYSALYDTGLLSSLFSDDGSTITPENFIIPTSEWTESDLEKNLNSISLAMERLGSSTFIRNNIPNILSSFASYLSSLGYNIIPTDSLYYVNINWEQELSTLVTSVIEAAYILDIDIKANPEYDYQQVFFDALGDQEKNSQLKEVIVGTSERTGLLDCELANIINVPDAFETILNSIPAIRGYVDAIDFDAIFSSVNAEDLKTEFSIIFDVANITFSEDSKIDITQGIESVDITDEEVSDELVQIMKMSLDSTLFASLYPIVMQSFLFSADVSNFDYLFGLSPYSFNFSSSSFIPNFIELVDLAPELYTLSQNLNSPDISSSDKLRNLDTETIVSFLKIVTSDFFNPSLDDGITSTEINNYNIYVVLENLFSREVFSSIGIVPIGKDDIGNMSFNDEEIERIGRFFDYAKANASFWIDDVDLEDSQAFENMLNEGLDSQILSDSIINIIDNSLQEYFSSVGINITLQEMRNSLYKEDADNISHILELKNKFSFISSDPLKDLDTQSLNVILSELSSTNLINYILIEGNTSTDINTNMATIIDKFLKHYDIYNRIGALDHFFESERCLFNRQRYELISLEGYDHQFTYCTYGEISGLTSFLSYLQGLDLDEVLSGIILADFISDCEDYLLQSKFASYFGITIYQRALDVISIDPNVATFVDHFDFYSLISNLPMTDRSDFEVMDLLFSEIITGNLSSLLAGENYDLDSFETFYNALTNSNIAYIYNDTYFFTPYEFLLYKVFSNSDVLAYLTDSFDESIQYKVFDSLVREIREEDRDDILEFIIFMNNRDISSLSDEEKDNLLDIIHNIPFFINLYNNL